jgi:hypothetical protein
MTPRHWVTDGRRFGQLGRRPSLSWESTDPIKAAGIPHASAIGPFLPQWLRWLMSPEEDT